MPRAEGATSTRVTRNSIKASTEGRKALGDASNLRPSKTTGETKKPATTNQTLRRSRRLSNSEEPRNPAEDGNAVLPARNRPLRASTKAQSKACIEPSSKSSKRKSLTRATSRKQVAKSKSDDSKKQKGTCAKRSRGQDTEEAERPKKGTKKSSRSRSNSGEAQLKDDTTTGGNPCTDILETTDYGLHREPFLSRQFTSGISTYDIKNQDDVQEVPGYVTDIFQRLFHAELSTYPRPYMEVQPQLNSMMRSILVDWIIEVHMKFRLLPETLYLCINIIDRYLSVVEVPRKKLQLVGVTALLVACKYEEIYPPEVKDCVYITDRAYTRQDVLDMEASIAKVLEFRITVPTGYPFLHRFLHITKATRVMRNLANFYMERMLQEYSTLKYRPSLVAAAAVSLAMNNPDVFEHEGYDPLHTPEVPQELLKYTGFCVNDIKEVASLMESKVGETEMSTRRPLEAVKRKYQSDRYDNASVSFALPKVVHLVA